MEKTYSKLNSTQKAVVKLLQQLVTEYTDRVLATQPCTAYQIPTGYSHPTQSIQLCVDSGADRQLVSTRYGFHLPVTKSTDWVPATQSLLYRASPKPVT